MEINWKGALLYKKKHVELSQPGLQELRKSILS